MVTTMNMLVRPQDGSGLRWSRGFEAVLKDRIESTLQATVGTFRYHTSSWEEISKCIKAEPDAAVQAIRELAKDEHGSGDVVDVKLLILKGKPGPPPKHVEQSSWFSTTVSGRGNTVLFDVISQDPVNRVFAHEFASRTLEQPLKAIENEARNDGNTYLFEVDKLTYCTQQVWESRIVLLQIRKCGDVPVTVSLFAQEGVFFDVICTNLGGRELATIRIDSCTSSEDLRCRLSEQIAVPQKCLKLVAEGGCIVDEKSGSRPLAEILKPPSGTMISRTISRINSRELAACLPCGRPHTGNWQQHH